MYIDSVIHFARLTTLRMEADSGFSYSDKTIARNMYNLQCD